MRIGELAARVEVRPKTIRYYEDIGVLPQPARAANGYRTYTEDAVTRLRFVREAQASGLSLNEIAAILDLRDRGEQTCDHVVSLLDLHVADLDRQIERLRLMRTRLDSLAERARSLDPTDCADPNRCQTIGFDVTGPRSPGHRSPGDPPRAHDHAT